MRNSAVKKNDNEWIKRNFKKCNVYTKWTKKIFGCTKEKLKSADNTSLKSIDQSGSRQQSAAGGRSLAADREAVQAMMLWGGDLPSAASGQQAAADGGSGPAVSSQHPAVSRGQRFAACDLRPAICSLGTAEAGILFHAYEKHPAA